MGSKQPKNDDDHSAFPVGLVMPDGSLAVADARVTQPSISCCISDFGAAAIVVMVVDVVVGSIQKSDYCVIEKEWKGW